MNTDKSKKAKDKSTYGNWSPVFVEKKQQEPQSIATSQPHESQAVQA